MRDIEGKVTRVGARSELDLHLRAKVRTDTNLNPAIDGVPSDSKKLGAAAAVLNLAPKTTWRSKPSR